ncbi:MAG: recombinase family protein [archaeon]
MFFVNMDTIIYLRTSTEDQNPQNQLKDCMTLCQVEDYLVVEEQKSAFKDDKKRTEFNKILNGIKKRECQHLIVWDFDRIYRNRVKLKGFFELCKSYGCQIHSFRQQWIEQLNNMVPPWNEIMFEFLIQVFGWIAEDESQKKSDRIKNAVRHKNGVTKSCYGNRWGRKPLSKQTIKKVLDLHKLGISIRAIAQLVNYWDKSGNKKPLSKSAVHKIIKQNSA